LGTFAELVEPEVIGEVAGEWREDIEALHGRLADLRSPYGDGSASELTVEAIGELIDGA